VVVKVVHGTYDVEVLVVRVEMTAIRRLGRVAMVYESQLQVCRIHPPSC